MAKLNQTIKKVPIFGIDRIRMNGDGPGITTLVTFMGCPLNCKYCLNKKCQEPIYKEDGTTLNADIQLISPQRLYNMVKIDNIYFRATGGGICFGGGEPALQKDFIKEFKSLCGDGWKITIETCLHYSDKIIKELSTIVDYWIVDIKSLNSDIFERYTGVKAAPLIKRLLVLKNNVPAENILIRVPLIPDYNDQENVQQTIQELYLMGFKNTEQVNYLIR